MKFKDLDTKEIKATDVSLRLIEPGHQVPVGNYQIIGQFCDVCNDVIMHVFDKKHKQIKCMTCKTIKQLK